MFIYWTKERKFQTENYDDIPWNKLHSPNEETPALIFPNGSKFWFYEGKYHRLTGAALNIFGVFVEKDFYLNGRLYGFKEWIYNHPNINLYLDAIGYKTNEEKALWKLKNL